MSDNSGPNKEPANNSQAGKQAADRPLESLKKAEERIKNEAKNSSAGTGKQAAETPKTETVYKQSKAGTLHSDVHPSETAELAKHREALKAKDITAEEKIRINGEMDKIKKAISPDKEAAWAKTIKPKPFDNIKARVGGVFGENSSKASKIFRGGGAAIGAIYTGGKIMEVVKPELDEQGNRKESLAVSSVKALVGAAATVALLVTGGKAKAMSMH